MMMGLHLMMISSQPARSRELHGNPSEKASLRQVSTLDWGVLGGWVLVPAHHHLNVAIREESLRKLQNEPSREGHSSRWKREKKRSRDV